KRYRFLDTHNSSSNNNNYSNSNNNNNNCQGSFMSSNMASPPIQFDNDQGLMAGTSAPGSTYGGYQPLYANMGNNNMNFNHPSSYPVPGPATPPSLPPLHNAYGSNGASNFPFAYHSEAGSTAPSSGSQSSAPAGGALNTPTGGSQGTDPLDHAHQHSPHPQQQQTHQVTPPQQHPQTPQQQQQALQRQMHQPTNPAQSPYQQSPQAHHAMMYRADDKSGAQLGMPNLMHGLATMPASSSLSDTWIQGQGRLPAKQSIGGLNNMGGMGMNGMSGMGGMGSLGGMPGMPSMGPMSGNDRMNWGGMVGMSPGPYGHGAPHQPQSLHQQSFHSHLQQQHPQYQQSSHLLQHPQSGMQPQHMGQHGRAAVQPSVPNMGPMAGGGVSKKKPKKAATPAVKDKNGPKRPRNSYIFFTLMKRDDIKKKHPEFKPTEITKMLGEEWQKLSEAEKESYGNMAENDKKRYQSEMENYDPSASTNSTGSVDGSNGGHLGGGNPGTSLSNNPNAGNPPGPPNSHNGVPGGVPSGPGGDMADHWRQ
ncbi:hypothetical protein BGW38_005947, partial [Lunasporangiospora selenospora]